MSETGRLRRLRAAAVHATLGDPGALTAAVEALEFVQYDPIRRPGRAQDLILRHRVRGYREGGLERAYDRLGLDEGYLHVYGAMTPRLRALADPRGRPEFAYRPSGVAADVLALVGETGVVHPREVAARLGDARVENLWGGTSTATTHALDELHRHWLVRVAGRRNGVKLYGPAAPVSSTGDPALALTRYLARLLMPVPLPTLRSALVQLRRRGGIDASAAVDALVASGELVVEVVAGCAWARPAGAVVPETPVPPRVRFLAPFDPVVWDRRRFELLWGWPYRFEAYTPAAARRFGYYALPLLTGDRAVGWVCCTVTGGGLAVEGRFAVREEKGKAFRAGFDREAERLAATFGLSLHSATLGV
ncbi:MULTISPECIES: DNA glycosylase AlkZ-like family protein [unclassified Amycolatopsis]|uniref:DNA glycosylase AlkZ-like family protein n=1 Tax=unclassified Amycolatopsis TaxID=2618356 RepID=UPI0028756B04|nr:MULTISPECIES: crosslink repair DNA glycosylase YcaQ family protein [unclassified Amycolatopsis]MDS0134516.1 YcaQ family DNA glycosylase [Amycolatopsis sp. 505]MDS0147864.1 YcaQ family DNA glycosylase [Amycolatopsis sp. CM201R]